MIKLPAQFSDWFATRGWSIHDHQQQMLDKADATALLLIAPTGGGKTLAGFLPKIPTVRRGTMTSKLSFIRVPFRMRNKR